MLNINEKNSGYPNLIDHQVWKIILLTKYVVKRRIELMIGRYFPLTLHSSVSQRKFVKIVEISMINRTLPKTRAVLEMYMAQIKPPAPIMW